MYLDRVSKFDKDHKCQRKPKGQLRIDNPQASTTLGTQETRGRQKKHAENSVLNKI